MTQMLLSACMCPSLSQSPQSCIVRVPEVSQTLLSIPLLRAQTLAMKPFSQIEPLLPQTNEQQKLLQNLPTWPIIFSESFFFAERLEPIRENIYLPKSLRSPAFSLLFFFFSFFPPSHEHCSIANIRDWLLKPKLYPRTNTDFMLQKISRRAAVSISFSHGLG